MGGRVVGIVQARMGSTRLPGKALASLGGQPLLAVIVRRVRPSRLLEQLVIATTGTSRDDPIAALAGRLGIPCFRGAEEDCLDRYYQAARGQRADVVVRLTGDNPLVEHDFVDWVIREFLESAPPCDYIDTAASKTFPLGLSVEVFSFAALETAWQEDTDGQWREHVTPFIYRHPDRFRVRHLASPLNLGHWRWTVDTPEDLALVRRIYEHLGHDQFSWAEAVSLLQAHPEWMEINQQVQQKVV